MKRSFGCIAISLSCVFASATTALPAAAEPEMDPAKRVVLTVLAPPDNAIAERAVAELRDLGFVVVAALPLARDASRAAMETRMHELEVAGALRLVLPESEFEVWTMQSSGRVELQEVVRAAETTEAPAADAQASQTGVVVSLRAVEVLRALLAPRAHAPLPVPAPIPSPPEAPAPVDGDAWPLRRFRGEASFSGIVAGDSHGPISDPSYGATLGASYVPSSVGIDVFASALGGNERRYDQLGETTVTRLGMGGGAHAEFFTPRRRVRFFVSAGFQVERLFLTTHTNDPGFRGFFSTVVVPSVYAGAGFDVRLTGAVAIGAGIRGVDALRGVTIAYPDPSGGGSSSGSLARIALRADFATFRFLFP